MKKNTFKTNLTIGRAYLKAFLYGVALHRILTLRDTKGNLLILAVEDLHGNEKVLFIREFD